VDGGPSVVLNRSDPLRPLGIKFQVFAGDATALNSASETGISVWLSESASPNLRPTRMPRPLRGRGHRRIPPLEQFPDVRSVRLQADRREVRLKPDTTYYTEPQTALALI